ncbi:MAG: tyrosine-type recombinase/integrase [Clostridiales bacterium]|nr:tyrosine-type recombinase/integrase [Clostridiales bacterium]
MIIIAFCTGVKNFTIHDLRHTFATRCLESGVAMKTIQKWLGHTTYGTTADIYSHVSTEFERAEIKRLSNFSPRF